MTEQLLILMGVVFLLCGIGALMSPDFFRKAIGNFRDNPGLLYLSAMINLILGLILVLNHNLWDTFGAVLVSIISWALIFRGAAMILASDFYMRQLKNVWLGSHLRGEAIFLILTGVAFLYLGL